MISDQEIRAGEFERKRRHRLVCVRTEWQAIQKTLADVDDQVDGPDFRSLKRIGDRDVSGWKAVDKAIRVESLRFREQALERELRAIVDQMDADRKARGFYSGPMIHADPTPNF